mmetsp:Transcript_58169/g.92419  ORF Transcript_58169/g.92419 Transcript_58169/m.92419 type:complete len:215 (-) Transcript_58169:352-996(-)
MKLGHDVLFNRIDIARRSIIFIERVTARDIDAVIGQLLHKLVHLIKDEQHLSRSYFLFLEIQRKVLEEPLKQLDGAVHFVAFRLVVHLIVARQVDEKQHSRARLEAVRQFLVAEALFVVLQRPALAINARDVPHVDHLFASQVIGRELHLKRVHVDRWNATEPLHVFHDVDWEAVNVAVCAEPALDQTLVIDAFPMSQQLEVGVVVEVFHAVRA